MLQYRDWDKVDVDAIVAGMDRQDELEKEEAARIAAEEEAARIARDADVGHLVLTHLLPPLPVSVLHPTFLGDSADIYSGPITVAGDGMLFSMPPDSTDIQEQWLLR